MKFSKTLDISLRALAKNKMRSFLTALGIIIGVGAVISMVSIGQGAQQEVAKRFQSMGTNLLHIKPGAPHVRGRRGSQGSIQTLTPADAEAIKKGAVNVAAVSPGVSTRAQVIYQNSNWNTTVNGVGVDYPKVKNWEVKKGRFFTKKNVKSASKVCVLGTEVKQNLFGDSTALDKIIRIKKIPFKVIGILKSKGDSGWFNQDDIIVVPYTTVQRRLLGVTHISSMEVSAVSDEKTGKASDEIKEILRKRHRIAPGAEDDFHVRDMTEIAENASESTAILTKLLGGIALVSLLVGGIGIMNIMLVSVTERIREIGIRMAIGAKSRDILLQFLCEAVTLSIAGGIIGTLAGIGASKIISIFGGWQTVISLPAIGLAVIFSASVGIFFGYYPARKAANMDPIQALRFE